MKNVFTLASNDQSMFYLSQIFGSIGSALPPPQGQVLTINIIGAMFKTFNTMALVLGAFVIVYTTIVGLLATAHEGEFMGKKWSGLWVPLRTVFGIAALYPMPGGYSVIQMIMMWCIVQGVGAADSLWTTALTYTQIMGSPYATVQVNGMQTKQAMSSLFQGLVCQAEALKCKSGDNQCTTSLQLPGKVPMYYCTDSNNANTPFCTAYGIWDMADGATQTYNNPNKISGYNLGPSQSARPGSQPQSGQCGYMEYCNSNATCPGSDSKSRIACAACTAQLQALQTIVGGASGSFGGAMDQPHSGLGGVAQAFANADYDYLAFMNGEATDSTNTPQWLISYCGQKQIPQSNCCTTSNPVTYSWKNGQLVQNANSCSVITAFDSAYSSGSSNPDQNNANTSDNAIKFGYWPYNIQTLLNAAASTSSSNNSNTLDPIAAATSYYNATITNAVTTALATEMQSQGSSLSSWQQQAQQVGWLYAGSFYYQMANTNKNDLSTPYLAVNTSDPSTPNGTYDVSGAMGKYRNNYDAASTLMTIMSKANQTPDPTTASMPTGASKLSDGLKASASEIGSYMNTLTGQQTNPLASMQSFGENILIAAQTLYAVFLTVSVALSMAGISVFALGTGVSAWAPIQALLLSTIPLILAFCGLMIGFGGMLAVYTPLIPFIVFTMAALGWFIGVIEAMVAAPLVAIGILSPGGQHEILGRAEPALMLLLNTMLRPSLMIFGMIFAMLLATVGIGVVNNTFQNVISNVFNNGTALGPAELIFVLAAYTFLCITVLNKCFSLIHLIPERVITWIGGHAVQYGEGEALGEVKRGTEAAGSAYQGMLKESGGMSDFARGSAESKNKKGGGQSQVQAPGNNNNNNNNNNQGNP